MNPTGGLARRKTVLKELAGPDTLVVEGGNALTRPGALDDAQTRERAGLIVRTFGALGTKVMAAGPADLALGVEYLQGQAKRAGLTVLSCNLEKKDGALAFPASTVLTVGGLKIAFVGLTGEHVLKDGQTRPSKEALLTELSKLGPHDVTVLLSTATYMVNSNLALEAKGKVDFVIDAGDARGIPPPQPVPGGGFIVAAGQKGQQLGKLTLDVGGPGPWTDQDGVTRDTQQVQFLDTQLKTLADRLAQAKDPQAKASLQQTTKELAARRAEVKRQVDAASAPSGRRFRVEYRLLDATVKDDEALKQEVLKVEPTYQGQH
jgi:2',3'-cyclic-nucleotide 2'-phosphodiesterase (5'-nucleotidase family)